MADPIMGGGVLFVLLQYLVAILVWIDARRLNLKNPMKYPLAIMFLVVLGWLLVLAYLDRRETLPRAENSEQDVGAVASSVASSGRLTWTVTLEGSSVLRRLVYGFNTTGRWLWWGWFVALPVLVFSVGVFRFQRAVGAFFYLVPISVLMAVSAARWNDSLVGVIEGDDGALTLVRNADTDEERRQEFPLEEIRSVRLLDGGEYVAVRCRYETALFPRPGGFLVPSDRIAAVAAALESQGVAVPGQLPAGSHGAADRTRSDRAALWFRPVVTALTVAGCPILALLL